ncbi:MAG TPA: phosphoenolpyruvate--protein phosphotransferase [Desulfobacterales bacterium]
MPREPVHLLEDICTLITDSEEPQKTLDAIVERIAARFQTDVCSVYIFNEEKNLLVLAATVGLKRQSVGTVTMKIEEGLTGLVLESLQPVFVRNPAEHPRYKYFAQSGEEIYQTFLGLPLVYHQRTLGVLVIQTVDEAAISEADIPVFAAITSQVAATVAYSNLLLRAAKSDATGKTPAPRKPAPGPGSPKPLLRGIPVCAGFAEGRAYYLFESIGFDQVAMESAADPKAEKQRLEIALQGVERELRDLQVETRPPESQEAAILEAGLAMVRDPGFKRHLLAGIDTGYLAASALKQTIQAYLQRFEALQDPYLRERSSDIEDIGRRVLCHLLGRTGSVSKEFSHPTVLVAADISAAELMELRQPNLKAIVLARGGKASHAAILAKSFEIPMVIGVKDLLEVISENDAIIVDGTSGLVFHEPPADIRDEYRRLEQEKRQRDRNLESIRDLPAETRDGRRCRLGANIGLLSDLELVHRYGADHIGLYRTEFPFLVRRDFPTEGEQTAIYEKILKGAAGREVTFRTLDVGSDKFLSYLDYPRENNPCLGWRSIRVSLDLDAVFRTQLRAILKAAATGPARILVPMITSVREMRRVVEIIAEEKQALQQTGAAFAGDIPVGFMLEVPGTVKILAGLLAIADFVSIGTNDLIQYTLAVDRNNDRVAGLYNPLHPAVIGTIAEAVDICRRQGKPVSICGESAALPQCAVLYLAMGVERLSMNPASIPVVKQVIRSMSDTEAAEMLQQVVSMDDETQIAAYLQEVCKERVGVGPEHCR